MSSITADDFQAAREAACKCLWQGNALIRTATEEPDEYKGPKMRRRSRTRGSGSSVPVVRLPAEIVSFCNMLDANRYKINAVEPDLLAVSGGLYEHERLVESTAHRLAWSFAHHLWLAIYLAVNEEEFHDGGTDFQIDRERLDSRREPIRDKLRLVKPIDAHRYSRLIQIESAKAKAAAVDGQVVGKPEEDQADRNKLDWSNPVGYKVLRTVLGKISQNTLKARLVVSTEPVVGKIRYKAPPKARLIQVVVSDLPADAQTRFQQASG